MDKEKPLIIKVFPKDWDIKECSNGTFKTECPHCGLQGNRTQGFILYPETNTWSCHTSKKHGGLLELVAMQNKTITCDDCCETGEKKEVLDEEQCNEVLDILKDSFGLDFLFKFMSKYSYNYEKFLVYMRFLHIETNTKGVVISKNVLIDNVADHIIKKFEIKTVFGVKEESLYVCEEGMWSHKGKGIIISEIEKVLRNFAKNHAVREVFDKIKRKTETSREEFEIVPDFMTPLINGVLDLSDVDNIKFLPHNKEYNFKKRFPVKYNPKAKCPITLKFIKDTFYDCDIPQVQEYCGLHLIRRYLFKKACLIQGPKNTGKSVYVNQLSRFCGKENVAGLSLQSISHGKTFDLICLKDAFANIHDDLSSKDLSDSGGFKMAVGDGDITGEQKFGDHIRFRNTAKQTFACNTIPTVENIDDEAYYDRWLIWNVEKVVPPEKRNPKLIDTITTEQELSGILNWFIEGYVRLIKQNRFSNEKTCEEIKELMLHNSNPLAKFATMVLEYAAGAKISKDEMYEAYCNFCSNEEPIVSPNSKVKIGTSLTRFVPYVLNSKSGNERYWLNVKFRDDWDNLKNNISVNQKKVNTQPTFTNMLISNSPQSSHDYKVKLPNNEIKTNTNKKIKTIKKPKSDRQVQFWDAKECKQIISKHTKEEVLNWIKKNNGVNSNQLYEKFGVGCLKFRNDLVKDGLIEKSKNKYFYKGEKK
jgi:P4 family phage/plasmid primase-like protien